MATLKEVDQYYDEIHHSRCKKIMLLLKRHPTLLKVGWENDLSREFSGSPFHGPRNSAVDPWKGRTALHVAAETGCVDLIVQVLLLFDFLDIAAVSSYHSKHKQGAATRSGEDVVATPGQSNLSHSDGTETNGDQTAHLKQKVTKEKDIASGGKSDCSTNESDAVVREDRVGSVDTTSDDPFSRKVLRDLLLAKRGYENMIALAIAAVQCNVDAIILLVYAHGEIGSPPTFRIGKSILLPKYLDQEESENRTRLRSVTKEFIKSLGEEPRRRLLKLYSGNDRFSFLPHEEYLLHHCCNFGGNEDLYKVYCIPFWKRVRSLGGSLWRFLLELQDGLGRTPFLAAMRIPFGKEIRSHTRKFVEMLKSAGDNEKEVEICAMTAPDAAGRTPAFSAAAGGCDEGIRILLDYSDRYEEVRATVLARWYHPCSPRYNWKRFKNPDIDVTSGNLDSRPWKQYTEKNLRWRQLSSWERIPAWLGSLSWELGLRREQHGYNGLHAALVHRKYDVARLVIEKACDHGWAGIPYYEIYKRPGLGGDNHFTGIPLEATVLEWDIVAFACFVGLDMSIPSSDDFVQFILENPTLKMSRQSSQKGDLKEMLIDGDIHKVLKTPWKYLHILASRGDYNCLKGFLDNLTCDPFIEDLEGNTALHYALHVREFGKLQPPLLDGLGIHLAAPTPVNHRKRGRHHDLGIQQAAIIPRTDVAHEIEPRMDAVHEIAIRKGCINLLLQVGCDAFKDNEKKQVPYPQRRLEGNTEFLSWWYDKQEKEYAVIQTNFNSATTAISVTATLVATASYVGPLQPPLGLDNNGSQMQYENRWVATFIFCDTLSFYLAVIALILSLVPSLPVPQQPMRTELRRTRAMVVLSMLALFPSIVCVLIAFASSSMAVVSVNLTSSIGGKLTIAPLSICVPFIIVVFFVLVIRLLGILLPQNKWIRKLYRLTLIEME